MRRTPLWLRLVVGVLALVTVTLLITGFAGTRLLRHYLLGESQQRLMATADRMRRIPDRPRPAPGGRQPQLPSDYAIQQYSADGTPGELTDSEGRTLPVVRPGPLGKPFTVDGWLMVRVAIPSGGYLVVATGTGAVDNTVDKLVRIDVGVAVVALLALGVACWALARTLGRIEADLLTREASEAAAVETADQLRRFVGDASHELRTPVTTIRGYTDIYRQQKATFTLADADHVFGRINREAVRMSGLVDDLLLLAQLDQHRPLKAERVELLSLAADVVLDDLTGRVSLSRDDESDTTVTGDPVRLRQAVSNLVDNALRHTTGAVSVRVGPGVVDVCDEGAGIDPAHAPRVFERFYRAGSARATSDSGAGLGLAIVTAVAEAHGGSVELVPSEVGAHFRLRIPPAAA